MTRDTRARDIGPAVIAVTGAIIVVAATASLLLRERPVWYLYELFVFHNGPSGIVLLWLAWLVLRRQPRHGAGLVLLAIGVASVLHVGAAALLDARLLAGGVDLVATPEIILVPAELPLDASVPLLLVATVWVPAPVLVGTMLLLYFPNGHLPSQRWRWVPPVTASGMLLMITAFGSLLWPTSTRPENADPTLVEGVLLLGGAIALVVAVMASVIAFVLRWRRSSGAQRRQFNTVGVAAVAFALVATALYPWQAIWIPAVLVAFNALMIAYALAAARYRLHDLEPVLGRTAVGTILAIGVAAVYLVIVVGAGSLVGRGFDDPLLPLIAVGVVALLIEPARRRVRRLVDRLLYRRHADRTEVLSQLAARASESVAEDVLDDVATLLVHSTGAARAEVWLHIEPESELAAAAGSSDEQTPTLRAAVEHHGQRLGELRLYARTAADLTPDAGPLIDDVAHSLGVVLRNARLTAALRAQLDELRRSRQRLVDVHDQARRGLERDIHDGAQARLIALRLRLGLARALIDVEDREPLREQLDTLGQEVDAAVRSLRELARGLQPPILEQTGVPAALQAHVRDLPVPVLVHGDGVGRYHRTVEGAVYFACIEGVQNAIRHAGATGITIELTDDGSGLRFTITDDGNGFDPTTVTRGAGLTNIDDRVSALGGTARVDSVPGQGTTVSGQIPVQPFVEDR